MALTEQAGLFTVPTNVKRSHVNSSVDLMTLQRVATSHTISAWAPSRTDARAKWVTKGRRNFVKGN